MGYKVVKIICCRNDELKGSVQSVEIFYSGETCAPRCNMGEKSSVCGLCMQKIMRLYKSNGISAFDGEIKNLRGDE